MASGRCDRSMVIVPSGVREKGEGESVQRVITSASCSKKKKDQRGTRRKKTLDRPSFQKRIWNEREGRERVEKKVERKDF